MIKLNFTVDTDREEVEVTVYCEASAGSEAPCFYCGKPGTKNMINIEDVMSSGMAVEKGTPLYVKAATMAKKELFSGRAACNDECNGLLMDDQELNAGNHDMVIG